MKKSNEYHQSLEVIENTNDYHELEVLKARTYVRAYDDGFDDGATHVADRIATM